MIEKRAIKLLLLILFSNTFLSAQILDKKWETIVKESDSAWFATPEAIRTAENVLLYQRDIGGWPKNISMHKVLSEQEKKEIEAQKKVGKGATIDNGATYLEMLFLSKMYRAVPDEKYRKAFLKGLGYLLEAQYDNGGWPQFYPLRKGYYSHITYNDDAMVNILKIMQEIANESGYFSIEIPKEKVKKAKGAFDKGIECILNTQYQQNGVLTAWCAQHDEKTLLPAKARAYELPSLSGKESAKIVLLLMSIQNPSKKIINAIESAVKWFEKTKIIGYREVRTYDEKGKIKDKVLVKDENARPIWARFMELEDNTPFFCDRDGIKKSSFDEISVERRAGYAWYTNQPKEVLKKYPRWKKRLTEKVKSEKKGPRNPKYIIVSKDGTGDYTSIQEAIDGAKSFPYERITIFVKNGVYKEKVNVHEWNTNLSLIGESKEKTIITWDDYFGKMEKGRNSTFYTPTLYVEADDFIAKNLTIENSAGEVGQAVALSVFANRVVIENCNLLGNQDTLYASGDSAKQYYKNCYIEGTTDFIFGRATALFENCIIHSKKNSFVAAASTPEGTAFGYVFLNCKLTADEGVSEVYLGRPWRIYAKTVFLNCELGLHILPEGWHNWNKPEAEKTAFYAEFGSYGLGGKSEKRVKWSHQLKKSEAKKYTKKNILGDGSWYEIVNK